jgi:hypothetical protein
MTTSAPSGRPAVRALTTCLIAASTTLLIVPPVLGRLQTWREEGATTFQKGRRERVVISDDGDVRLGRLLKPVGTLDAARVWDLARGVKGEVYAATGDEGKVFRKPNGGGEGWTAVYDAKDTQALSLTATQDGRVYVGTGPTGQVVDVSGASPTASRPDPKVQYVWDLASDSRGNVFAATGPTGQLWKRSPDGTWSLLLDSKHPHLLSVAVSPDGSVFAGSDGDGLVYKVDPAGKVSVLYDAPQSEVRALLLTPDGTLYAGTAVEAGAGGGGGRGSFFPGGSLTGGSRPPFGGGADPMETSGLGAQAPPRPDPPKKEESRTRPTLPPGGGSAAPKPISPGDNAVYRIDRDGVVREVFRAKALIFALAFQKDRVLVGTGPEGQLFELRDDGEESSAVARLDSGQILSLLSEPAGAVLLGTGEPASVARLEPGHVGRGALTSDVRDTKLISRFGALGWRADVPARTSVSLQARSGNVAEPDATWSAWSPEQTDPRSARALVPPGRFVQYRATLTTADPAVSPELHEVTLRYQTANLAPEIHRLDVPDVSALDGAARASRMTFRWEAADPNDDDLSYNVYLRKDAWPDWIKLNEQPLTERTFAWDSTSVPAGSYRVRLTASDRPANNPDEALTRDKVSESFVVDHEAPRVTIKPEGARASARLEDALTRIVKASYALDGGDWVPVFPDDGLYDTPGEDVTIPLPDLKPGTHVLVIRATDAAGNLGTGDALLVVP